MIACQVPGRALPLRAVLLTMATLVQEELGIVLDEAEMIAYLRARPGQQIIKLVAEYLENELGADVKPLIAVLSPEAWEWKVLGGVLDMAVPTKTSKS